MASTLGDINPNNPGGSFTDPSLFANNSSFTPLAQNSSFMNSQANPVMSGLSGPNVGSSNPFQVQSLLANAKGVGGGM